MPKPRLCPLSRLTPMLIATWAFSVNAQVVDLSAAYVAARTNDPSFRVAVAERDAGAEEVNIARARLLPSISASYSNDRNRASTRMNEQSLGFGSSSSTGTTQTDTDSTVITNRTGDSVLSGVPVRTIRQENETQASNSSFNNFSSQFVDVSRQVNGSSAVLQLRQSLIDFEKMAAYRQGKALTLSSEAYFQDRQQELMLRVATAYAEVLFAYENVMLSRVQLETLEEQLKANERMLEAGVGTVTDIMETRANRELARAAKIEAEDVHSVALNRLKSITGLDFDDVKPLRKQMALLWQPGESQEAWKNRAMENSAFLRSLRHRVDSARYVMDRASAAHMPRLDLVVSLSHGRTSTASIRSSSSQNDSTRQTNETGDSQETVQISSIGPGQTDTVNTTGTTQVGASSSASQSAYESARSRQRGTDRRIGVELTIPIFSGGGISARERQAVAQLSQAEADFERQLEEVSLEINRQLRLIQSHSQRAQALVQAVEASTAAVEATRRGMTVGVRSNIDVINAQERLTRSQRDLANAQYSFLLSYLQIRYLSGVLSEVDLRVISDTTVSQ